MTMSLEAFRQLPADEQRTVLTSMRERARQAINAAAMAELADVYEAQLVPQIPLKRTVDLPPVPDQETAVRQLMRADSTITEIVTSTGVRYRR